MLAIAAIVAIACSQNQLKYDVTGENAPVDGAVVYLIDQISSAHIDSAVVAKGAFKMKGKAEKDAFLSVNIDGDNWWFLLFNDGTPVRIDVAEKTVSGSELNNKLTECDLRNSAAYEEYNDFIQEFLALPEDEQAAKEEEFIPQYMAQIQKYSDALMETLSLSPSSRVSRRFSVTRSSMSSWHRMRLLPSIRMPLISRISWMSPMPNSRRMKRARKKSLASISSTSRSQTPMAMCTN